MFVTVMEHYVHSYKNHIELINKNSIVNLDVFYYEQVNVYAISKPNYNWFSKSKIIKKYIYYDKEFNSVSEVLDSIVHPILGHVLKFDNMKNIFYFSPMIRIEFSNGTRKNLQFKNDKELNEFYNKLTNENFIKMN